MFEFGWYSRFFVKIEDGEFVIIFFFRGWILIVGFVELSLFLEFKGIVFFFKNIYVYFLLESSEFDFFGEVGFLNNLELILGDRV